MIRYAHKVAHIENILKQIQWHMQRKVLPFPRFPNPPTPFEPKKKHIQGFVEPFWALRSPHAPDEKIFEFWLVHIASGRKQKRLHYLKFRKRCYLCGPPAYNIAGSAPKWCPRSSSETFVSGGAESEYHELYSDPFPKS